MFCPELYVEVKNLVQKYGWENGTMNSNIYKFAWQYLNDELSLEDAEEKCFYEDWHLAKRQLTWFKRNSEIKWMEFDKICSFVIKYIQDEQNNKYTN